MFLQNYIYLQYILVVGKMGHAPYEVVGSVDFFVAELKKNLSSYRRFFSIAFVYFELH